MKGLSVCLLQSWCYLITKKFPILSTPPSHPPTISTVKVRPGELACISTELSAPGRATQEHVVEQKQCLTGQTDFCCCIFYLQAEKRENN